ncbi:hypothetical protein [Marimonas arenosa]|uniref:Uncharacterized protein n=1 Tax=Marimonas arenosa TaxID=1795305 RepID=A0AAE3WAS0_9RHOB|nr:hypothetical protein [Marimonas arenosa]MDQ2089292.1 hypothetical protein [Marimonas arenosa]
MALRSDAAMVLFYDIEGDTDDHDDWHSYEHFHERLSVPGFLRATRWIATDAAPRYMVIYEVSSTDIGMSQPYLERLNDPTEWTGAMMPRFRGMTRGFCNITTSVGFGLGRAAMALRFQPVAGSEADLTNWLSNDVLLAMADLRGIAGAHLLQPVAPPPMTREQALRGADKPMPWLIIATCYDVSALDAAVAAHLSTEALRANGAEDLIFARYALHYTADTDEVARTAKPPSLSPEGRRRLP